MTELFRTGFPLFGVLEAPNVFSRENEMHDLVNHMDDAFTKWDEVSKMKLPKKNLCNEVWQQACDEVSKGWLTEPVPILEFGKIQSFA